MYHYLNYLKFSLTVSSTIIAVDKQMASDLSYISNINRYELSCYNFLLDRWSSVARYYRDQRNISWTMMTMTMTMMIRATIWSVTDENWELTSEINQPVNRSFPSRTHSVRISFSIAKYRVADYRWSSICLERPVAGGNLISVLFALVDPSRIPTSLVRRS